MRWRLRLSVFWFFAAGALGLYFPYFSLYLRENVGLSAAQVGVVTAVPPLVGLFAQPLWGQIADRTGSRTRTLAVLAFGAGIGYLALTLPRGFAGMLGSTALFAIFGNALMPMGVSVSLGALEPEGQRSFGRVRVWGTIGYLGSVVFAPRLLAALPSFMERVGARAPTASQPGLGVLFLVAATAVWMAAWVASRMPQSRGLAARAAPRDYLLLLQNRPYLRVLLFMFLSYFTLHGPMVMFPIFIRARGGDVAWISDMWIAMLLVEIPLMMYSGSLFVRLGGRRMLTLAAAAGGTRWLVSGLCESLWWIFPLQMLHAVTVSGLIVGGALAVESIVPRELRSTAQSGLTLMGANIGGVAASLSAGFVLSHFGVDVLYVGSGLAGLLVALLAARLLPDAASFTHGSPRPVSARQVLAGEGGKGR